MKSKPLQILFRGEAVKTVEKLQKKSGSKSKAEVIRDAIVLYDLIDNLAKDGKVVVRAEGSNSEQLITIPRKNPTATQI